MFNGLHGSTLGFPLEVNQTVTSFMSSTLAETGQTTVVVASSLLSEGFEQAFVVGGIIQGLFVDVHALTLTWSGWFQLFQDHV